MYKLSLPNSDANTNFPLINAVLDNLQQGIAFSNELTDGLLFIIHKAGFSYLTRKDEYDYLDILTFLLTSKDIPEYFHLYDPPVRFVALCNKKDDLVNVKIRKRFQLKFDEQKKPQVNMRLPTGYTIQQISSDNFKKISIFNLSIEEKFWKSKEDFRQNGFGFCVFDEAGMPVSICYTACVARNIAEIDVATLPEYQRKGFANNAVGAFVRHCIEHKITANWDCFEDNSGSLKTAQSIGFRQIMTYNFLSIFNKRSSYETN